MPRDLPGLTLSLDAAPLALFIELFERARQGHPAPLDAGDRPAELGRIERSHGATPAGELALIAYPSDGFLRYAATVLAGDFHVGLVEDTGHEDLPDA